MKTLSSDIATKAVSGNPSGKQFVRIAIGDACFRTDAELADKGRFVGRGLMAMKGWGGRSTRSTAAIDTQERPNAVVRLPMIDPLQN